MYPQNMINSILDEHQKFFSPYSAKCEYQIDLRAEDKPVGVASVFYPPQVKNHNKIKQFETNGYEIYEIDELTIITYNSIENFNPDSYRKYIPKPMLMTKMLELIDKSADNF